MLFCYWDEVPAVLSVKPASAGIVSIVNDDILHKIEDFFGHYPKREFAKGEILIHAGEEPKGVLYLLEGQVSQYDIAANGNEVVVNVFKPHTFFPMSWAINKTPNRYFFKADSLVMAHQAPAGEAVAFLRREPEVVFDLLSRVYRGTDGLLRRTAHLMGGDARSRLLFEILNAANRFGSQGRDGATTVPLNEGELAKRSGLARETVSRAMQSLKVEGLVTVSAIGITVPNIVRLEGELGVGL